MSVESIERQPTPDREPTVVSVGGEAAGISCALTAEPWWRSRALELAADEDDGGIRKRGKTDNGEAHSRNGAPRAVFVSRYSLCSRRLCWCCRC